MTGQWIVWAYETAGFWFSDRATFWRRVALLATARRVLHQRVAEWEAKRPRWSDPGTELLAAHYAQLTEAAETMEATGLSVIPTETVERWQRMELAAADSPPAESDDPPPARPADTDRARELWAVAEAIVHAVAPLHAPPSARRKSGGGRVH